MPSLVPMLVLLAQVPAPLAGTAVDREGRPLAGVEIVLSFGQATDGTAPILGRATTDSDGRYELAAPNLDRRSTARRTAPYLNAYRPGSALVASVTLLEKADPGAFRLVFEAAGRRTFTLRDGDGRPLAGVRLAPLTVRRREWGFATLPNALADRMEVTTGPDGRAELACLEPTTELMDLRATIPGLGTHLLALPEEQVKSEAVALDLKPAGRMRGRVLRDDGQPAAGVEVDVWSRAGGSASLMPVRFEAGPVRTSEDGTFRTPSGLLVGGKYRALVRAEGFKPVLTEWVTPGGQADAEVGLGEVVLTPLRSVAGRVVDRQGRPVAGAEVVAGGENASAVTDEQGAFRLAGLAANPSFLVVRREGFRIDGRLLAKLDGAVEVVLARFEEPATRPLTTLSGPIPPEERRRLARRVLDPYLVKVLAKGEDSPKAWALRSLMVFDPAAALEALDQTAFQQLDHYQSFLRRELSKALARVDPEEAAAVAESIPEAYRRAEALVDVCVQLTDDQRPRKLDLIDRALVSARAEPEPKLRAWQLGEAADLLLDLGETDRAKVIFAEGRASAAGLGPNDIEFVGYLAARLARVDLPAGLALLGGADQAGAHPLEFGNLAARVAASHPAEAEGLVGKVRGLNRTAGTTLRTCQNMAQADLARARRIAMDQEGASLRAAALVFTAYGLRPSEQPSARELVRQALEQLDQAREPFDRHQVGRAALMPLVESIDPALVPEFFWRTVADLAIADDPRVEYGREDVLRQALLLARYDVQVAAALFEPAARASAARGTDAGQMSPSELQLLAAIDPRRAVAVVEAMPEPGNLDARDANWSRIILSEHLGGEVEKRWSRIWDIFSGLGGTLGRRDVVF